MRLDLFLKNNFDISRTKADELIGSNRVYINGIISSKSSYSIKESDIVTISDDTVYVSRAAEKLRLFLNSIALPVNDLICIDAGASTGGFTQILLENNVKRVYSIDVGSKQLHESLLANDKIISIENCDIRNFTPPEPAMLLVCDLSFISLSNVLSHLVLLSELYLILLFKPQFEVGKNIKRDGKGVVKDTKAIETAMKNFESLAFSLGLNLLSKQKSLLKGKNGNEEYFYFFKK